MILAGWVLVILGLGQVIYAGTLDVTQLIEGNRLLGIATAIVADPDKLAQRSMIHQSGLASFLAGAVFLGAAYLKPAPTDVVQKSWSRLGALAAGALSLAALVGFGISIFGLNARNAQLKTDIEARLKSARAEASARQLEEIDRQLQAQGGTAADAAQVEAE
jgi:hypothetical protein